MENIRKDRANKEGSRPGPMAAGKPSRQTNPFPVVGIGASAGGLSACIKFLDALPADNGMAFILVQHLEPNHKSMMVDLLAGNTSMTVRQATDGMPIEREHLYVIPPGVYLSVGNGALRLSKPAARHGARLPIDFLLHSLAEECGERAVCVILSGTGADGSLGLKTVKEKCGLVIAQDPAEAEFDGMPRSAIMTGAVDRVLPVAKIPGALINYSRRIAKARAPDLSNSNDSLRGIVDLLRTTTEYDFTLYKPGTLRRRIERRMAMASDEIQDMEQYCELLRKDEVQRDDLAKDLLINVTSFFRDPAVFDFLAEKTIPELIDTQPPDRPLRIWIAGCSTGEEAYSLAMLLREETSAAKRHIKVQIFASDIDPDAIAIAREGYYPESIEAEVTPARLDRFFSKEEQGYRIIPELRSSVIFTVQDLLNDPPFSRLDMISCRNLLIYLLPEAQAKALSLFHFALREDKVLLLGASESVGNSKDQFEAISMSARVFRHIGHSRPGELFAAMRFGDASQPPPQRSARSRASTLAELCKKLLIENYTPAAVLLNRKHECLYFFGPTDRYLHVAQGLPTQNLFAMVSQKLRNRLRSAIQRAVEKNERIVLNGVHAPDDSDTTAFDIAVQPVLHDGEPLLLICFVDKPVSDRKKRSDVHPQDVGRVAELELELQATRMELEGAIHNLEVSSDEQTTINEEALSINEEFQSTNEELLTSKEELQSLNEELSALNSQLQETLERERTISDDLQNVLYSTDIATIFLDTRLNIRFFTPAAKSLFNFISGDIGRPLQDLNSLSADSALLADARSVLATPAPIEREIEASGGVWYLRRILPYRTQNTGIEGVVITFTKITERKLIADALEEARRQADLANAAKSRFLAVASHDLRQPLQTLALLQGLLTKTVEGNDNQQLVVRIGDAVSAMSSMLNALLDINQIEAGTVHAEPVTFPINDLLDRLRDEFTYHAAARGLTFRVVRCSLSVHSDPALLEMMIRNLISNAMKFTPGGKILLGCRRRQGALSIEVWDSGIGIHEDELSAIFEEYYQVGNSEHDPSRGLGLGLSIVLRLANLLDHRINVRARPGKGSAFTIEIKRAPPETTQPGNPASPENIDQQETNLHQRGTILVVDDEPELLNLLGLALRSEGHRTVTASNGSAVRELMAGGGFQPDLVVTDYNCQRRSKIRPVGRSKTRPLSVMRCSVLRVVPVVHRRDPRCFV